LPITRSGYRGDRAAVQLAIREVCRQQVEAVVVGLLDGLREDVGVLQAGPPEAIDVRTYSKGEARCRLRVEIPEQRALAGGGTQIRQIDGRRCLPDAALHVVDSDHAHRALLD
jgi:hypothetical protein